MPRDLEAEKAMYETILEVCREVKSLFCEERQTEAPRRSASELAHYRTSLEAGLKQLQGQWKETLGEHRD